MQVRSDWHDLGEAPDNAEFCILLCTGGPAVRITGSLRRTSAVLSSAASGLRTPWTDVIRLNQNQREALQWYCDQFCWEDC